MTTKESMKYEFLFEGKGNFSDVSKKITDLKNKIKQTINENFKLEKMGSKSGSHSSTSMFLGSSEKYKDDKAKQDYILKTEQMRGSTTGFRHEVGSLRNILLLYAFALGGVVSAFKGFFEIVVTTDNAMKSLRSVAANTGLAFERLQTLTTGFEDKGIMSIGGSSAAVKNLSATKLSISETTDVLNALTDAAAFNRQGTLGWEESVVGATQGIKNFNSIMVDNAGITKNISVMSREYANTIGKTVGKLLETEKRQALVNGIISEAAIFAGDAQRAMSSYQGQISKFNIEVLKMKRVMGNMIAPDIVDMIEQIFKYLNSFDPEKIRTGLTTVLTIAKNLLGIVLLLSNTLMNFLNILNFVGGSSIIPLLTQFALFLTIGKKLTGYFSGLREKFNFKGAEASFMSNKGQLLYLATTQKVVSTEKQGLDLARQKYTIQQVMGNILKRDAEVQGTSNAFIKEGINLRLKELSVLAKQGDMQAKLEIMRIKEQARLSGFGIAKSNFSDKSGTNYRIVEPGGKAPAGFSTKGQKGILPSEGVYANLGLGQKLAVNFSKITSEIKISGIAFKEFWNNTQGLLIKATGRVDNFSKAWASAKVGMVSFGNAAKIVLSGVFSMITSLLSYIMVIVLVYELISSVFTKIKEKNKALEEAYKNLKIEQKSIYELNKKTLQLSNQMFNSNFTLGYLYSKNGDVLSVVQDKLETNNESLKDAIALYGEMIKKGESGEILTNQLDRITSLREKENEYINEIQTRIDSFKESLSNTISMFAELASEGAGAWGSVFTSLDKFYEQKNDLLRDSQNINAMGVENLYFNAQKLLTERYYNEVQKVTLEGEKKISQIIAQSQEQRLKGQIDSFATQLLNIKQSYENQKREIQFQLRSLALEKANLLNSIKTKEIELTLRQIELEDQLGQTRAQAARNQFDVLSSKSGLTNEIFSRMFSKNQDFFGGTLMKINVGDSKIPQWVEIQEKQVDEGFDKLRSTIVSKGIVIQKDLDAFLKNFKDFSLSEEQLNNMAPEQIIDHISELSKQRFQNLDFISSNKNWFLKSFDTIKDSDIRNKIKEKYAQIFDTMTTELSGKLKYYQDLTNQILSMKNLKDVKNEFAKINKEAIGLANETQGATNKLLSEVSKAEVKELAMMFYNLNNLNKETITYNKNIGILQGSNSDYNGVLKQGIDLIDKVADSYLNSNIAIEENRRTLKDSLTGLSQSFGGEIPLMKEFNGIFKELGLNIELKNIDEFVDYISKIEVQKSQLNGLNVLTSELIRISNELPGVSRELRIFDYLTKAGFSTSEIQNYTESVMQLDDFLKKLKFTYDELGPSSKGAIKILTTDFVNKIRKSSSEVITETGKIVTEVKAAQAEYSGKYESFFDNMFGVPKDKLNSIKAEMSQAVKTIQDQINITKSNKLSYGYLTLNSADPEVLKAFDDKIKNLTDQQKSTLDKFIVQAKTEWQDYFNWISENFEKMGYDIGDTLFNQLPELARDKEDFLKEQEDLFRKGEIDEMEHGRRVLEINKYFSDQVNNAWKKAMGSILSNFAQMISQVIQQSVINNIVNKIGDKGLFSGIGNLFSLDALGGMALSAGIGFGLSALENAFASHDEAPTFESPEKDKLEKFGGGIKAEDLEIHISPTFIIEGEQIFIGSGSVVEFVDEATSLMKNSIQQAIDNREIDLSAIKRV
jgi:hypothetical protein